MGAPTIGILALQGAYDAHARMLHRLGVRTQWVRTAAQLHQVDGLILPGGESTAILHLLWHNKPLAQALRQFVSTKPCLGTCAGLIVLAAHVMPTQMSLAALSVTVERNAYGRQCDSRIAQAHTCVPGGSLEAILIRAPRIVSLAPEVQVLATYNGSAVWVEQGLAMGCSFHPELGVDTRVHERLVQACS